MQKKDIIWIDWAKFIGIFLVVFGHVLQCVPEWQETSLKFLWDWIYLFHMPLFFIISGYLYKQKTEKDIKKIFYALVLPYLLYQIMYSPLMVIWVVKHPEVDSHSYMLKLISGILMGDGYETPHSTFCCLPCWFIVCIIQLRILFNYIRITKLTTLLLCASSIIFLYARKVYDFDLYCCIDCTIMAIPYYLVGYWMKETNNLGRFCSYLLGGGGKFLMIRSLMFFCAITAIYYWNGVAQMIGPSVGKDVMLNYIAGLSGSFLIISLSYMYKNLPVFVKTISRNTLFIIFFHWSCKVILQQPLFPGANTALYMLECVSYSALILGICYFVIKFVDIYCPILLGKYKK